MELRALKYKRNKIYNAPRQYLNPVVEERIECGILILSNFVGS